MGCDLWLKTSEESGICVKLGRLVGGRPRYEREKRRDCPLTEVSTPHGRLIDADKLLESFREALDEDRHFVDFFALVDDSPTVIEAEVNE